MRYRKKPVVVNAEKWDGKLESIDKMEKFIDKYFKWWLDGEHLVIQTLEGEMWAAPGDMIIKGVNGEYYPCKIEIFDKTYEPVLKGE